MAQDIQLSVVIPVFNEERRIGTTMDAVLGYLEAQTFRWEVLLVDDGSTDRTRELTEPYLQDPRIRLLDNRRNRGKGYSVQHGMREARGAYALFTDADNATPIEMMDRVWPAFEEGAEVVIGSRELPDSDVRVPQGTVRRFMGRVFSLMTRTIAVPGIIDTQCGFKAFSRSAREIIFPLQTIERWGFDPELLFIARAHGLRIAEVPVVWINSADTKISSVRDSTRMFLELLSVRWKGMTGRYRRRQG